MEKHIYNEQTGISYTMHGDYYLPDLMLTSKRFVMSSESCLSTRRTMRNCVILRNEKNAKKKSVAVNNGHALKALAHEMGQCAAADLSALKGFGDVSQTRFSSVSA